MKPVITGKNLKLIGSIFFVLIIAYLSFYPCLKNDFTNWDDLLYLTGNPAVRSLSIANLRKIFTSFVFGNYHPLTIISYAIEYHLFQYQPFIYHLTNLILHLLNCLLVFWLIYLIAGKISTALITAILFGIHPLHVEPVAWISARKDLFYSFFFLGALINYLYYLRNKSGSCYYLAVLLYILSLLSKAMAISLPLVLFLVDYISYRKYDKIMVWDKIIFLVLSFCFGMIAVFGLNTIGVTRIGGPTNPWQELLIAGYAVNFYLCKIFAPIKLACVYPYTGVKTSFVYSLLAASLLAALAVFSRKYTRKIFFGSAFFLSTVFPVLQFVPVTSVIVADRYAYIPLVGTFYIIGEAVSWLYGKKTKFPVFRLALLTVATVVLIALPLLTRDRCKAWKNSLTLWKDTIEKMPEAEVAYYSLGCEYQRMGKNNEAKDLYWQAIKINPRYLAAYNNLAVIYVDAGQTDKAIYLWDKVVRMDPSSALGHAILAKLYFGQKQFDFAIRHCDKVLELGAEVDRELLKLLQPFRK